MRHDGTPGRHDGPDDERPLAAPRADIEPDGRLTVPAADLTTLLRSVARSWSHSTRHGAPVLSREGAGDVTLDAATVHALAEALERIADQLDTQFIGLTSRTPPGR